MSKILEQKVNELFEATKDLMSFEEIKPHCEQFNEWVNTQTSYSNESLGTVLSRVGFYKKFKGIKNLVPDKNAVLVETHSPDGSPKGTTIKHYVLTLCGLTKQQWDDRNQTTRSIDRLENSTEIDPDKYLEVTGKLLGSSDPHELAVGLIAATGRRPHEIIARAKFTAIPGKVYHVMFEGQGKKRGDKPVFEIATLYPADYVIKGLSRLRREPNTQALLKEITAQFPKSITKQNVEIDKRRNGSLNRVVRAFFGDKGEAVPVLSFRHGEEQDNNKALRAAYGVLATERDCQGSFGAKILYASKILGHFTKEIEDDKDLARLGVSAGYSDYFITKTVPFPPAPQPKKEKTVIVRATEDDFELLKKLQEELELPNQQAVVSRLVEFYEKAAKELISAKNQNAQLEKLVKQLQEENNQLQKKLSDMETTQASQTTDIKTDSISAINPDNLEAIIGRIIDEKLQLALKQIPAVQAVKATEPVIETTKPVREKEVIDWELKSNEELWSTKAQGAATEKIRRSFEAICAYNDTLATGETDRLAITNLGLRALSGTNGMLVGEWIKAHADEIVSHNSKHGMQNSKDPSKVETYYNKRHGQEKIQAILKTIDEKFLNGQALGAVTPTTGTKSTVTPKIQSQTITLNATEASLMDIEHALKQNPGWTVTTKERGKIVAVYQLNEVNEVVKV